MARRRARENPIEIPILLAILAAGAAVTGGVVVAAVAAKKNAAAAIPTSIPATTATPIESTEQVDAASATSAEDAAIEAASENAATNAENLVTTQQNNFLASLPPATQTFTFTKGTQVNLIVGDTLNLVAPITASPGMTFRFTVGGGNGLQAVAWNSNQAGASVSLGAGCFKAVSIGQFTVTLDQIDLGTNPPINTADSQTLSVSISSAGALTLGP